MDFRILTSTDFEQWNAIRTEALDVSPFAFGSSNEDELRHRRERFNSNTERTDRFILGLFHGSEIIGIAGFYRHEPVKTFHKGTIWSVFVKREYQGQGLGKKLMLETLERAWKMEGLETMLIGVSSNNPPAIELYRGLGFTQYGREPKGLKHDGKYADEILMFMKRT